VTVDRIVTASGHTEEALEEVRQALGALPPADVEPEPLEGLLRERREWATERYAAHAAEPDYDLPPAFVFSGRRGAVPLIAPFDSDEEKEFVFTRLAPLIMEGVRATRWCLAHPVWGANYEDEPGPDEEGYRSPRDRADRFELVHVHGCDLDRYVSWMAPVDRTERGVRIGVWEQKFDVPWTDAHGLTIDPLNKMLAAERIASTAKRMVFEGDVPEGFWTEEREGALRELHALMDEVPDEPGAAAERLRELLADDPDRLFLAVGILERDEAGNVRPSRMLLEHAGLPELAGREAA
jgi:hypothetical protein